MPLYTVRYIMCDSNELEMVEYESESESIKKRIRERKVEAADDNEAKLKVMKTLNKFSMNMDQSDPKFQMILDILDERGRSLKGEGHSAG